MNENKKTRVVILGGGFGGVYTAMHLEKLQKKHKELEIILVNKENYFVYQPMLAEVVGGSLGILDTVSSLRRLLPKTTLYIREIQSINTANKTVTLAPQFSHTSLDISYDHLVLSLGTVTDFRGLSGIHEHALPFKNLADTLVIRNRIIDAIESAAIESNPKLKQELLTFVIGGGGFSGTEVVAEVNDFARRMAKDYPTIDKSEVKVILIHSKERLMDIELSESLGNYAGEILQKRGVEIRFGLRLSSATPQEAILSNGEKIPCKTVISTVPSSPNPLMDTLELPKERGKVIADQQMQVQGQKDIWAIGDCSLIPAPSGEGYCPATAQFAIRQATVLAHNIVASLTNTEKKTFTFKGLGMMGALGHQRAVAELFGSIKISGIFAWMMWRAVYWIKLPGMGRKIKVMLSWLLDMIVPTEAVQLKIQPTQGIVQLHYETGEIIFHQGDIGDYLYIIVDGKVQVLKNKDGKEEKVCTLSKGEYFGEMALLSKGERSATVQCMEPTNVLALRKRDFGLLISNFDELKRNFESTDQARREKLG